MAFVSTPVAAAEFHSLSPPCVHSAETPGPFIPQPGTRACGSRYEGFRSGSCSAPVEKPRMFSASYQRYSGRGDAEMGRRGDGKTGRCSVRETVEANQTRAQRSDLTFTSSAPRFAYGNDPLLGMFDHIDQLSEYPIIFLIKIRSIRV